MPCMLGSRAPPPAFVVAPRPPPPPTRPPHPPTLKVVREWEGVGVWPNATPCPWNDRDLNQCQPPCECMVLPSRVHQQ